MAFLEKFDEFLFASYPYLVIFLTFWANFWLREAVEDKDGKQTLLFLVSTVICCSFYWRFEGILFYISIILLIGTYINVCTCIKKVDGKLSLRRAAFVILSLLLAMWITVLFGKYSYENELTDISQYERQLAIIYDSDSVWSYVFFLPYHIYIFFNIGIKNYFTPLSLSDISITNFNFIQFAVGVSMISTIFPAIASTINDIIKPTKENDNLTLENSTNQSKNPEEQTYPEYGIAKSARRVDCQ